MALQKYRADYAEPACPNGAIVWYARWMGGPSRAKIQNCPIDGAAAAPRTVYIAGEPDTYFSQPAACRIKGRDVRGWISFDESGPTFHPNREVA